MIGNNVGMNSCRAQMVQGLEFEIMIPGIKSISLVAPHVVFIIRMCIWIYVFVSYSFNDFDIINFVAFQNKINNYENIFLCI